MVKKEIGQAIGNRRRDLGLTQRELAEMCGSSRSYVAGIETGIYSPSLKLLLALCDALNLHVEMTLRSSVKEGGKDD